jgi:hypothetical protein
MAPITGFGCRDVLLAFESGCHPVARGMADITLASGAFEDPVLVTGLALGLDVSADQREAGLDVVKLGTGDGGDFLLGCAAGFRGRGRIGK